MWEDDIVKNILWLAGMLFLGQLMFCPCLLAVQDPVAEPMAQAEDAYKRDMQVYTQKFNALKQQEQTALQAFERAKTMLAQSKSQEMKLAAQEQASNQEYTHTQNSLNQLTRRRAVFENQARQLEAQGRNLASRAQGVRTEAAANALVGEAQALINNSMQNMNPAEMQNVENQIQQAQKRLNTLSNQKSQLQSQKRNLAAQSQQLQKTAVAQNVRVVEIRRQIGALKPPTKPRVASKARSMGRPRAVSGGKGIRIQQRAQAPSIQMAPLTPGTQTYMATPVAETLAPPPVAKIEEGGTPMTGAGISEGKLERQDLETLIREHPEALEYYNRLSSLRGQLNDAMNRARAQGISFGAYEKMIEETWKLFDDIANTFVTTGASLALSSAIPAATFTTKALKEGSFGAFHVYEITSLRMKLNEAGKKLDTTISGIEEELVAQNADNAGEIYAILYDMQYNQGQLSEILNVDPESIPRDIPNWPMGDSLTAPTGAAGTSVDETRSPDDWPYDPTAVDLRDKKELVPRI